jgi:hypothetical protein
MDSGGCYGRTIPPLFTIQAPELTRTVAEKKKCGNKAGNIPDNAQVHLRCLGLRTGRPGCDQQPGGTTAKKTRVATATGGSKETTGRSPTKITVCRYSGSRALVTWLGRVQQCCGTAANDKSRLGQGCTLALHGANGSYPHSKRYPKRWCTGDHRHVTETINHVGRCSGGMAPLALRIAQQCPKGFVL